MNGQCAHTGSHVWSGLRGALRYDNRIHVFLVVIVTFLLPIFEGLLASVLTSAIVAQGAWKWLALALVIVAILHLVLGIHVTMRTSILAPDLLAEAVESQSCCTSLRTELRRREEAYRMVREAFDSLNEGTCAIDPICEQGFETGLKPIMQKITKDIHTVLGVRGALFTVEVYFGQGYVPRVSKDGKRTPSSTGLALEYFYSPEMTRAVTERFTPTMIVLPALHQGVAKQQTVDDDRGVFYDQNTGRIRDDVYFQRFALHPILESCSGEQVGILLLTSRQGEPFAGDALETLAFISSLLARYVFAYRTCIFDKYKTDDEDAITQQVRSAARPQQPAQPATMPRPRLSPARPIAPAPSQPQPAAPPPTAAAPTQPASTPPADGKTP